jgi:hypothetical protein
LSHLALVLSDQLEFSLQLLDFSVASDVLKLFASIAALGVLFSLAHQGLLLLTFAVVGGRNSVQSRLAVMLDLQLLEPLTLFFVQMLQFLKLFLTLADPLEKIAVSLLLSHELGDHLTHIRVPCALLDL